MSAKAPAGAAERQAAAEAWNLFCDSLKEAGQVLLRPDLPAYDLDLAEGLRYLSRLTHAAIERHVEGSDPANPLLYLLCDERIKVGGDNPDNRYFAATLNDQHEYVLTGDFRACSYFSVVATGRIVGTTQSTVTYGINSDSIVPQPDGTAEIHVGRNKRGVNHLEVDEHTTLLILRCTIETPGEKRVNPVFRRIDEGARNPLQESKTVAGRLQQAAGLVRSASSFYGDWAAGYQAHINAVPLGDQPYIQSVGGDPNILYYLSAWAVPEGSALIVKIPEIPACRTWNFQLCNVWMESLDYTESQIHVNRTTAAYDEDGGVTIVIAHQDPGHPNWLRTQGHVQGTICMRLTSADRPVEVKTSLVSIEEARR